MLPWLFLPGEERPVELHMRTAKKANVVYSYLLHGIEAGKFRIGERIPAERDLAAQFNLARPTVTAAIRRLVKENMIRRGRRTGSVVMNLPPRKSRTFGAIIMGLVRQPQEQSIFNAVGNAISYCAASDHSVVLLQDPSWGDDPKMPGMAERYRSITDQFIARKVDGVFLMPQWIMPDQQISASAEIAEKLEHAAIPVVLIDADIVRYPARSHFDLVGIDNFHSGYILATHFLKLGCRKIDFFALATRHPTQEARIAGYLNAMETFGLHPDAACIHHGNLLDGGFVLPILHQRRPEAILVANDLRAAAIMRLVLQDGIKVPDELRIGGFDDMPLAAHLSVPLTTIRQPAVSIGSIAYHTLLKRINDPGLAPMHTDLNSELVVRASSGTRVATHARTDRTRI